LSDFVRHNSKRKYAILSIDESSAMLTMTDRATDRECIVADVTDERCIDVLQRADFWLLCGIDPITGESTNA
jgi:hypothetical protein